MPGSKIGLALMRVAGFVNGNSVADSSVYLDGHTLQVDVMGNNETANALQVRRLAPSNNLPTQLMALDKTGALTALVRDTGGQVFNVKAYGADVTGATDSSPAFVAAIAAANATRGISPGSGIATGGGTIFVPAGTYLISSTVAIPNDIKIVGVGGAQGELEDVAKGSLILAGTTSPLFTSVNASHIEGLNFENYLGSGTAIRYSDLSHAVYNCTFQGFTTAIDCPALGGNVFIDRCGFVGMSGTSIVINRTALLAPGNIRVTNCHFNIRQAGPYPGGGVSAIAVVGVFNNPILNLTIRDNWIANTRQVNARVIDLSYVQGFDISHNIIDTVEQSGGIAVNLANCSGGNITENVFNNVVTAITATAVTNTFEGRNTFITVTTQRNYDATTTISQLDTNLTLRDQRGQVNMGSASDVWVGRGATGSLDFAVGSGVDWQVTSTHNLVPIADNARLVGTATQRLNGVTIGTAGVISDGGVQVGNGTVKAGTFYSGSGVPSNGLGANGDLYLRTDGGAGTTLYQRRVGVWVATAA